MTAHTVYFIKPAPNSDYLLTLGERMAKDGYALSLTSKDALVLLETQKILLELGPTAILAQQPLIEDVLPDNSPKNVVLDTLRFKLDRCSPQTSLVIVDSYIYPAPPDSDYISSFLTVFRQAIQSCREVTIVTKPKRNRQLEAHMDNEMRQINPQLLISKKYTDDFHDRFWIVDDAKGIYVGTSLNGVGQRYALVDYLNEADVSEIVTRIQAIP